MITTSWHIVNLERESSDGYVYTAHWTASVVDGEYSAGSYGSVGLERPEGNLIPFENLTETLVISWIQDKLGDEQVISIEESLKKQIEEQKTPQNLSGIPW